MSAKSINRNPCVVYLFLALAIGLSACSGGIKTSSTPIAPPAVASGSGTGSEDPAIDSAQVTPGIVQIDGLGLLAAKPGELVTVTGRNLIAGMKVSLNDIIVDLTVVSPETATFIMPQGVGIGLVDVKFVNGTSTIKTIALVSDSAPDDLPITLMAPELVCKDVSYRNGRGEIKKGLRDCTTTILADCTTDGETNCRANDAVKGAVVANMSAKVVSGASVAGVAGTVPVKPVDCSTDGEVGCVTTALVKAAKLSTFSGADIRSGMTVAGVPGILVEAPAPCGADGAISCVAIAAYPAVDKAGKLQAFAAKIRSSLTIAGVPGTLPDCATDGSGSCFVDGTAYKAAKLANFVDSDIRSGIHIAGVTGNLTGAPSSCGNDAETGCIANSNFKAADMALVLAGNVRSGITIAGVLGGYPSASHPLDGADGTTDLPAFASTAGATTYEWFKSDGARLTGTVQTDTSVTPGTSTQTLNAGLYRSVVVAGDANLVATKIKLNETIFGVTGTSTPSPGACAADGDGSCVVDGTTYKAAKLSNFDASKILDGTTIAGVGGSVGNCGSNGAQSCVATGSYKAATTCSASGSNCYLPAYVLTTQPLKAVSYDAIDAAKMLTTLTLAGVTGTVDLSNLAAGNVKDQVSIGGVTGSYGPVCSSDGQQNCLASGSYKALNPSSITAASMLSTQTLLGVTGTIGACGSDGASACYVPTYVTTTQPYKAINFDNVNTNKSKIRDSVTIASVAGTLIDCATDGATTCVAGAGYPAAKVGASYLDEKNIKNGVTIAGVTGLYPSATYPLTNADAGGVTTDLDTSSFDIRMKSATQFQWWDQTGTRYTHAGDADIATTANILTGVNIFGTDGSAPVASTPNAWDIRIGTSINGVTGKLPVSCRNTGTKAVFDIKMPKSVTAIETGGTNVLTVPSHGYASNTAVRVNYSTAPTGLSNATTYYVIVVDGDNIQLSASSGPGSAVAVTGAGATVTVADWNDGTFGVTDTIDDYYNYTGSGQSYSSPWAAANVCGGIESSSGDVNVWKDVTTDGSNVASTCAATAANCSYQDKISGLQWTKTPGTKDWASAMLYCQTLTYNNKTGWRLPTSKEILEANIHGIMTTAGTTGWITVAQMRGNWQTSTTQANGTGTTWVSSLASGYMSNLSKSNNSGYVICVQ